VPKHHHNVREAEFEASATQLANGQSPSTGVGFDRGEWGEGGKKCGAAVVEPSSEAEGAVQPVRQGSASGGDGGVQVVCRSTNTGVSFACFPELSYKRFMSGLREGESRFWSRVTTSL
jgi:hypothetical protein